LIYGSIDKCFKVNSAALFVSEFQHTEQINCNWKKLSKQT